MGLFDSIDTVKVKQGVKDAYLEKEGDYTVELLEAKSGTSKRGWNWFLVKVKVLLASTYPGAKGTPHEVGETVTHMIKLAGFSWETDIKTCVSAFFGIDPNDVDSAAVTALAGPTNPGKGKKARVRATTKDGSNFTKTAWRPL